MMRKLAIVVATMAVSMLVLAAAAFASSEVNPPTGGGAITPPTIQTTPPTIQTTPPVAPPTSPPPAEVPTNPQAGTVRGVVVKQPVVKAPSDGLAFTGATISLWMVVAAALLIGGMALLFLGRRRRLHAVE